MFRQTEKACVVEQEEVARDLLERKAAASSGMTDLFADLPDTNEVAFKDDRRAALAKLKVEFASWVHTGSRRRRNDLLAMLMQRPLIYRQDCAELVKQAVRDGMLSVAEGDGRSEPTITPLISRRSR